MFCTKCGHKNPDTSKFCSRCGTKLKQPVKIEDKSVRVFPENQNHPNKKNNVSQNSNAADEIKYKQNDEKKSTEAFEKSIDSEKSSIMQNQYDENGNLILPVYEENEKKGSVKIILGIIAALIIMAGGIIAYNYYVESVPFISNFLKSKPEIEVKKVALQFAELASQNKLSEISSFYPDIIEADSIALSYQPDEIEILSNNGKNFEVRLNPSTHITITQGEDGNYKVIQSKGLFVFPENQLSSLSQSGQEFEDLSDLDIVNLIRIEVENNRKKSFTSPDLDLFNLHGPVKEMTISYTSSTGNSGSCFEAWGWAGNYNFNESGEWTNYRQRFAGGIKRNKKGQIIGLYEDFPDNPNAPNSERPPFVEYQWSDNKVIKFEVGFRSGNYSSRNGSLTYDSNGVISGENMTWYGYEVETLSNLKLHNFEFDQYGNWISCTWTETVIYEEDVYAVSSLNQLPYWLKNATASLNTAGVKDFYAMEADDDYPKTRKTKETYSGKIKRIITYY